MHIMYKAVKSTSYYTQYIVGSSTPGGGFEQVSVLARPPPPPPPPGDRCGFSIRASRPAPTPVTCMLLNTKTT
jgi:hypothetical protein